ncbi:tetrahydrofolate dehydrogenase/cyclohydrolase catalytic domain-containing protein [Saliphagus infecundisoli]|uniref:Bifunctional protein FolD n=1 Tax=Saliphagus infecundisoli TaxID=1849069 RepID=A0ABD5QFV1_9EURY|nr:tetrahydrofolate dehydrogenase/cyclohydrolase catalytic domain-containing protein [Saliphagus infecundisoli]
MTEIIDGDAVAASLREELAESIEELADAGVQPGLATVLMSDDPASETYVSMKREDCREVGIEDFHRDVDSGADTEELMAVVADLNERADVHGVLVQTPLPDQVDSERALRSVTPLKDVDGFHPENVGRLVRGDPRYRPCTPHGVQKLLDAAGVETEGADAVVVGRSNLVGKPLANLLLRKAPDGNATVTVCHSRTDDLAEKTRGADIVVAAAGVPELIDGSMLAEGATVIDVGYNHVDGEAVGDVAFESARETAGAITPVPGGVGPMTRAMLLYNTVKAASIQSGTDVSLP